ncbi:hypothetical protein Tco_0009894 [Tanacetum coccineum]
MDDPNITMEEYIRLEEEKAQKCGKVFNWETAKYGKIWFSKLATLSTIDERQSPRPAAERGDNSTAQSWRVSYHKLGKDTYLHH